MYEREILPWMMSDPDLTVNQKDHFFVILFFAVNFLVDRELVSQPLGNNGL